MQIHMVPNNAIRPSDWSATYILKPERNLLRLSMLESGWLQPLVVRFADSTIIDGFHRWQLTQSDDKFIGRYGADVPVVYHDVDEIDSMILHIRLNRARGSVNAFTLSTMVRRIVASGKYDENDLSNILLFGADETDLLLTAGALKRTDLAKHTYSRAWVPIEAPKQAKVDTTIIERPPNPDR